MVCNAWKAGNRCQLRDSSSIIHMQQAVGTEAENQHFKLMTGSVLLSSDMDGALKDNVFLYVLS